MRTIQSRTLSQESIRLLGAAKAVESLVRRGHPERFEASSVYTSYLTRQIGINP